MANFVCVLYYQGSIIMPVTLYIHLLECYIVKWVGKCTDICVLHCVSPQRYPADKAYFIAKEILMTERTYLKDLEVITLVSYQICSWRKV